MEEAKYTKIFQLAALDIEVHLCKLDYLWFFDHRNKEQILKEAVLAPSVL